MPTKTLVLHIGDPKTGSSSIQQALYQRRVECTTVAIDYPPKLNSVRLANSLRRAGLANDRNDQFRAAANWLDASIGDVGVISAEQFSLIDPHDVHQVFVQHMPKHAEAMRVVAYVRPHVSRFIAAYAQRVKVGSLQSDIQTFFNENADKRFLNFSRRFQKWRNLYGDRFILRPMVREELWDGDVVADFIGIVVRNAPFRLLDVAAANKTLPVEALSGLQFLQKHLEVRDVPGGTRQRVGSQINQLCDELIGAKGTKLRIGRDLYDRICDNARADAENLDKFFFGRSVLVKAMDESALDTVDQPMGIDARSYFSSQVLARLTTLAETLADLFAQQQGVWRESIGRRIGQRTDGDGSNDMMEEATAYVAEIDAILEEVAALISVV